MPDVAYESSSGGPFMRDINTQSGDDQELYVYWNSGHVRTEPWRFGLNGPYAMRFTFVLPLIYQHLTGQGMRLILFSTGEKPNATLDTSFFETLSIQGYVPASKRGTVSGFVSGVPSNFQAVVHWHNTAAQYWTIASPSSGKYTSPLMKPGTYTTKLYRNEFLIAQSTVTITAGGVAVVSQNISSTEPNPPVVWRIGTFDGQPFELKNGDKIERMHPSDTRMASWGGEYTVGKSTPKDFPMALFSKQGGTATVKFSLSKEQAGAELTLRVGTTLSFKGGRPDVRVGEWRGKDPGAPVRHPSHALDFFYLMTGGVESVKKEEELMDRQKLIDSRGVTRGAYRGYGEVYTWKIPAGTLKEGANTLTLGVYGSGDAAFLSANYIVDAVELQGPVGVDSPK